MNRKTLFILAALISMIAAACGELEEVLISSNGTSGARMNQDGEVFVNYVDPFNQILTKDSPKIIIAFAEPMDQASVEKALLITPELEYQTSWVRGNLKISFIGGYQIYDSFTISLTKSIKTAEGKKFPPTSWVFSNQIPTATPVTPTKTPTITPTPTPTPYSFILTPVPTQQAWVETALFPVPYQPLGVSHLTVPTPIATPENQAFRFQLKEWSEEDALAMVQMLDNFAYESDVYGTFASRGVYYRLQTPLKLSIVEAIYRFPKSQYSEALQWKLAMVNGTLGVTDSDDWIITTLEEGLNSGRFRLEDLMRLIVSNGFTLITVGVHDLFGLGEDGQILIVDSQFNYRSNGLIFALREIHQGVYNLILLYSDWSFLHGGGWIYDTVDRTGNGIPEIMFVTSRGCDLLIFEWQGDKFADLSRGEISSGDRDFCRFEFDPGGYPEADIETIHLGVREYFSWNGEYYELVDTKNSYPEPDYFDVPRMLYQGNFSEIISLIDEILNTLPIEQDEPWGESGPAIPDLLRFYQGMAHAYQLQSTKAKEVLQSLAQSPIDANYPYISQAAQIFLEYYQDDLSILYKACNAATSMIQTTLEPYKDDRGNVGIEAVLEVIGVGGYPLSLEDACEISLILPPLIASFDQNQIESLPALLKQAGILVHNHTKIDFDGDGKQDWILEVELPQRRDDNQKLILVREVNGILKTDILLDFESHYYEPVTLQTKHISLPQMGQATIFLSGRSFLIIKSGELTINSPEILLETYGDGYEILQPANLPTILVYSFDEYIDYTGEWIEETILWWSVYQWNETTLTFEEVDYPFDLLFHYDNPEEAISYLQLAMEIIAPYEARMIAIEKATPDGKHFYGGLSSVKIPLLYLLGLAYELNGDEALAVQTYYQVWREHPDSAYALMARAKLKLIEP